jgi:hypothetical protein
VLIGHSFGGLVLKSLVVKLKTMKSGGDAFWKAIVQRGKAFLSNVRGVAFYAVPHAGSSNIAKYVTKLLPCNTRDLAGIMGNIRPGEQDMQCLSVDFDDIVTENEIIIRAFYEGRPTGDVVRMCWRKWILQVNTCDVLMLFGADLCNLGSMTGLGNSGGLFLGTTISRKECFYG